MNETSLKSSLEDLEIATYTRETYEDLTTQNRFQLSLCLLLLAIGIVVLVPTSFGRDNNSTTLDSLLKPGASLRTLDGSVEFDGFAFNIGPLETNAPDPTEIHVEAVASNTSDEIFLQFRNDGATQIIPFDKEYNFDIIFQVRSLLNDHVFSEVSLNIDGASLGTSGTGIVQLQTSVFPTIAALLTAIGVGSPNSTIADLEVIDDGDGIQVLSDVQSFRPGRSNLQLATTVWVSGGGNINSGAVLTDFQIGLVRTISIPEPEALILILCAIGMWGFFLNRVGSDKCRFH